MLFDGQKDGKRVVPDTERSSGNNSSQHQLNEPPKKSSDRTFVKYLFVDEKFSEGLRKNCKKNKTTLTAAIVVIALAAVRYTFSDRTSSLEKFPKYLSWIVTSSMRHLLPESRLLFGAEKNGDPGLSVVGSYGGSVLDPKMKVNDKSKFWDRARKVRAKISSEFFPSMRRQKLLNWVYRKPKLWKYLGAKTGIFLDADLESVTRTYAVEVANLGAWQSPCSLPTVDPTDPKARMTWFAGTASNSFKGARSVVFVSLITIGTDLGISAAFNSPTISEAEAEQFMAIFTKYLEQARQSPDEFSLASLQ
jgi:hypothetical protein